MNDPQRETLNLLASLIMRVDDLHRTIREKPFIHRTDLSGIESVLWEILAEHKKTTNAVLYLSGVLGAMLLTASVIGFIHLVTR